MSHSEDVLDRLLGSWTNEYKVGKSKRIPEEKTASGRHTFTRVLGGRFVKEEGSGTGIEGFEHFGLWLNDAKNDTYTLWYFTSTGEASKGIGKWDADSQTLVTSADYGHGVHSTDKIHFKDDDTLEWSTVVKDVKGTLHYHLEGTSKRVEQ